MSVGYREMAEGGTWVTVASAAAIAEGDMIGIKVGDKLIALYNVAGRICATDNVCTHAFAVLTDGWLDGGEIECPLHAGRFDVATGKGLGPPIPSDLKTYKVRIDGDEVQIDMAS
jgi:nitrite reductase/ring-hydroxylating ferredoxin subunit